MVTDRFATFPREQPCRVYLNKPDFRAGQFGHNRLDFFGVDDASVLYPSGGTPIHSAPISRPDLWNDLEFHSSCSLQNIVKIEPCIIEDGVISGLLLHYADGHRECVGTFRLDKVDRRQTVFLNPDDELHFRLKSWWAVYPRNAPRGVAGVGTEPSDSREPGLRTWSVPQRGRLEWWYAGAGFCSLYYDGSCLWNQEP